MEYSSLHPPTKDQEKQSKKARDIRAKRVQNIGMALGLRAVGMGKLCAVLLLAGAWAAAAGQQSGGGSDTSSQPQQSPPAPTQPTAKKAATSGGKKANNGQKSSSGGNSDNAFPASQSEAAAKAASQQSNQAPANSSKPNPGNSQRPADKDNPFPEEQSKAAAKGAQGPAGNANDQSDSASPAQSTSQSSSSSGYSSSDAHLLPQDVGQGTTSRHEKPDSYTRDQTRDGRIEDDLNVADLYMKNGNFRGGYLRYEDALEVDPQNETALFGMAEAMCRQNMTGDALERFRSYIHKFPAGKYEKKSEKYLTHPYRCSNNR